MTVVISDNLIIQEIVEETDDLNGSIFVGPITYYVDPTGGIARYQTVLTQTPFLGPFGSLAEAGIHLRIVLSKINQQWTRDALANEENLIMYENDDERYPRTAPKAFGMS